MLTVHSVANSNYQLNPAFGKRNKSKIQDSEPQNERSEFEQLKDEYEAETQEWKEQKKGFEEMIRDKEANLPKPIKTTMKTGVVLTAGVLGGMATGYSARYIMTAFQNMYKSKQIQNVVKAFNKHVSTPISKKLASAKEYISLKLTKFKQSDTYKSNTEKLKKSQFITTIRDFGKKVSDNKIVKTVLSPINYIFGKFGDSVVWISNKFSRGNIKNTTADALGVAGGISTGACTLMDEVKANEPLDLKDSYNDEED